MALLKVIAKAFYIRQGFFTANYRLCSMDHACMCSKVSPVREFPYFARREYGDPI